MSNNMQPFCNEKIRLALSRFTRELQLPPQVFNNKISHQQLLLLHKKFVLRNFALNIFDNNTPLGCLHCAKHSLTLHRRATDIHIFSESVSLILERKCGSFQCAGITQRSSSCIDYIGTIYSARCGVLFICAKVIPQPPLR